MHTNFAIVRVINELEANLMENKTASSFNNQIILLPRKLSVSPFASSRTKDWSLRRKCFINFL
ncbi:MAG: hypothetical protein ACTS4T_00580 [Candidatus Hodgkinia cicadicola]